MLTYACKHNLLIYAHDVNVLGGSVGNLKKKKQRFYKLLLTLWPWNWTFTV